MGFMSALEKRSNLATPEKWLVDWFSGGIESTSGVRVTSATAMTFVAVYSCIDILSRTVGSLPLYLYRRLPEGGKELARKHPLFRLMRREPNPEMSAGRYRSTLQGHLASWGNAYSYIEWGETATLAPSGRSDRTWYTSRERPDGLNISTILFQAKVLRSHRIHAPHSRLRVRWSDGIFPDHPCP